MHVHACEFKPVQYRKMGRETSDWNGCDPEYEDEDDHEYASCVCRVRVHIQTCMSTYIVAADVGRVSQTSKVCAA